MAWLTTTHAQDKTNPKIAPIKKGYVKESKPSVFWEDGNRQINAQRSATAPIIRVQRHDAMDWITIVTARLTKIVRIVFPLMLMKSA